MQGYLAALTIVLFLGMVLTRVLLMRRTGTRAVYFGHTDKTDFLIPPFALLYIYAVFAEAFNLPFVSTRKFFDSDVIAWIGVFLCAAGLVLVFMTLVSFGRSFRVGIDTEDPDELVTTGVFAWSRNPIYMGFILVLLGQFLVFPNWILLAYFAAGIWLIHRQVLREEEFLRGHYSREYAEYCARVRRYL